MNVKTLLIFSSLALSVVGCNESSQTPQHKDFENIIFESETIVYDGQSHCLSGVQGIPENTNVTYDELISHTDVGAYKTTAVITNPNYNTLVLSATLTITKSDFSNLIFEDVTITYDGQPHSLSNVQGVPENTNVTYDELIAHTDVGAYKTTAVITNPNYNTQVLSATLTISKADFSDLTFENKSTYYDGNDHFNDVELDGQLSDGTTQTLIVKNSSDEIVTSAIEVGVYTYSLLLENSNYNDKTLTATLTIREPKKQCAVSFSELDLGNVKQIFGNGDSFNNKIKDYINGCVDEPIIDNISTSLNNSVKIEKSDFSGDYENVQGLIIGTSSYDGDMTFNFTKTIHSVTIKLQQYYNIFVDYYQGVKYNSAHYDGQRYVENPEGEDYYEGYFQIDINNQLFEGPGSTYEYDDDWNLIIQIPEIVEHEFVIDSDVLVIRGFESVRTRIYEINFEWE